VLTLPKLVDREAQPYVAIRERVSIPFGPAIDKAMPEIAGWLAAKGVQKFGPAIFKYNIINMPDLEIEFGFTPEQTLEGDVRVISAMLPAGKYATVTYFGHYDDLIHVTGLLVAWGRYNNVEWDSTARSDGEHFVSRFELYPNGPMDEPDPQKWETQIFIKVRD
jgi:effector-binding domain-containing protein